MSTAGWASEKRVITGDNRSDAVVSSDPRAKRPEGTPWSRTARFASASTHAAFEA